MSLSWSNALRQLLSEMHRSERWSAAQLKQSQTAQLTLLIQHAKRHSPFYRDIDQTQLPILKRATLQAQFDNIKAQEIPHAHLPTGQTQTSGSSGKPVTVIRTSLNQLFWQAHTLHEHMWQARDVKGRLGVIRAGLDNRAPQLHRSWGQPADLIGTTGPAYTLPINCNISEQVRGLQQFNPDYLLVYPSNLAALLDAEVQLPRLKQIKTLGETLPEHLRHRAEAQLNVKVFGNYSSQELGNIALQCPLSGLYHIMAESLIVEVLKDDGSACAVGDVGRVVITDLYNFATPLIRYELDDYAEVGPACSCGKTLPTLKRILGRSRNMLSVAGEKRWPLVGFHRFGDIAPVKQYQIIQTREYELEVRLVVEQALNPAQEKQLGALICTSLGFNPSVRFRYFDNEIPRSSSGKFEEFISCVN